MAIQTGEKIPSVTVNQMTEDGPAELGTDELFAGKKVVVFALPGAFTPTCSAAHLPGFVAHADALKAKGVDDVVCVSVNDAFVMAAWGEAQNATGSVRMVADGSANLTQALGLELDLTARGMGVRSQRYAMIVDDGVVSALEIDEPGTLDRSSAESILAKL